MKRHFEQIGFPLMPLRSRRGFAVPFMLMLLTLLFTFLIAAQGTVIGSAVMVKRSAQRADEAGAVTAALNHVSSMDPSAIASSGQAPVVLPGDLGATLTCTAGSLAAGDSLYGRLPGVSHREGDVLVRLSLVQSGSEKAQEFLLNTSGSRGGIIGL